MIRPKRPKFLLHLLALLFVAAPLFAEAKGWLKSYPRPLIELEKVITDWLTHSDFEVHHTLLTMGRRQLTGVKANQIWKITLIPHSPLAARVQAQYTSNSELHVAPLEELRNYIAEYVSGGDQEVPINLGDTDYVFPPAVLSLVESAVCIEAKRNDKTVQVTGTVVDQDGVIVCTAHDLDRHQKITVFLHNGQELNATLVKLDPLVDLALLHVNAQLQSFAAVEHGRNLLSLGERLYSVNCAKNGKTRVVQGVVSGPPRKVNGLPLWQVTMEIHPGSSGSPVFDVKGDLVAIVKGRYRGTDSTGFLIPLETIINFAMEMETG
jgi:serine protease Do